MNNWFLGTSKRSLGFSYSLCTTVNEEGRVWRHTTRRYVMYLPAVSEGRTIFTTCDKESKRDQKRIFLMMPMRLDERSYLWKVLIAMKMNSSDTFTDGLKLTCPRLRPKYRATGSPCWIRGNWDSFSLLRVRSRVKVKWELKDTGQKGHGKTILHSD